MIEITLATRALAHIYKTLVFWLHLICYFVYLVSSSCNCLLLIWIYTSSSLYTRSCMEWTTKQYHEKQYRISVGVTQSKSFCLSIYIIVHVQLISYYTFSKFVNLNSYNHISQDLKWQVNVLCPCNYLCMSPGSLLSVNLLLYKRTASSDYYRPQSCSLNAQFALHA